MKHVYKDFQELYATLRGKVVEVQPKERRPVNVPKALKKEEEKKEEKKPAPKKKAKKEE